MARLVLGAAVLAALVSGCTSLPAPPPRAAAIVPQAAAIHPPKLIVAIAVDQFSADLFDEYRANFTGGLGRLASEGTVFRNGYQPHAATETCPGHSTILTGEHPAHTGIIANSWFQLSSPRGRVAIYCAEDETKGDPINYVVSPVHLRVPVLGELIRAAFPQSQSVAVSGKDRAAVMMGGHRPDARWYYRTRSQSGKFESDLPGAVETPAVEAINRRIAAEIGSEQAPPLDVPAYCVSRDKAITLSGGRVVGTGRFAHGPDEKEYHYSPALDRDTLALAEDLVDEHQLGRHAAPDLLAVSLSATDYVGHRFGTEGLEMCLQLHELDQALGHFFADLDSRGIDYAVVLTADHGGTDIPERLRDQGVDPDAKRVPDTLNSKTIGQAIATALHLGADPLVGEGDIYVMPGLEPPVRARVIEAAVAAYRSSPLVAQVFTKEELEAAPIPTGDPTKWTLKDRARASFDAERSGDIIVLLKHHVVPIARPDDYYATTHGSAWDNDRRVPIIFWRASMHGETREEPIETVDIMPTLAAMIGLPVPAGSIDGHCLTAVQTVSCPR